MKKSQGEILLATQMRALKVPHTPEFQFMQGRKWRFDFALNDTLAVEVDGGNHMARIVNGKPVAIGRHTKAADYEKLNAAAAAGWRVMRFTTGMVKDGSAINAILKAIGVTK